MIAALLITYAILRHQLLDFSFVLRKGLLTHSHAADRRQLLPGLLPALTLFHSISGFQVFIISLIVAIFTAMIVQPCATNSILDRPRLFPRKV
jgi:hypothetical protein